MEDIWVQKCVLTLIFTNTFEITKLIDTINSYYTVLLPKAAIDHMIQSQAINFIHHQNWHTIKLQQVELLLAVHALTI